MKELKMTVNHYKTVMSLAEKSAYRNTHTVRFDEYMYAGILAVEKALKRFDPSRDNLDGYVYRCVENAMASHYNKMDRCDFFRDDNVSTDDLANLIDEVPERGLCNEVKRIVADVTARNDRNGKNASRNAHMVRLFLGIDDKFERMSFDDIASLYDLSYESVRLIVKTTLNAIRHDRESRQLLCSYVA